jgi:parallel beta-helix repeat protein
VKAVRAWHTAYATDPGLERGVNEDRVLVDEERGLLLVVDGLGGHAAGEMAAETAVRVIDEQLSRIEDAADTERLITDAITEANNRIYELALTKEDWYGMACVLTLAIVGDEFITVGHVGDTRLYLVWNGTLRKITSDHSPVGEKEDSGILSEEAAMSHPRRNEVFRDVGSHRRRLGEANFVEIRRLPFRPDAALLFCSDGLSDVLKSSEIVEVVDRYDGDPQVIAHALVEAANRAGGRDNVSVIFVAGPEFLGGRSGALEDARARHATTRPRTRFLPRAVWVPALALFVGIPLGMLFWALIERLIPSPLFKSAAKHVTVNSGDPLGIVKAVNAANAGDILEIAAGEYLGPLQLKDGITLIAAAPHQVILRCAASGSSDAGIGLVARGVSGARVRGITIAADPAHPLRLGALLVNSSVELDDLNISGASEAGIRITGSSAGTLLANYIHGNAGPGITVLDTSSPRLAGNTISGNGTVANALRPGIDMAVSATPVLENNVITRNGLATLGSISPAVESVIRRENLMDAAIAAEPLRPGIGAAAGKP